MNINHTPVGNYYFYTAGECWEGGGKKNCLLHLFQGGKSNSLIACGTWCEFPFANYVCEMLLMSALIPAPLRGTQQQLPDRLF